MSENMERVANVFRSTGNQSANGSVLRVMTEPHTRRILRTYGYVFPFALAATFTTTTSAYAQQSLFNVPSAKLTTLGDFFFQEQLAFSKVGESNLVTEAGLGKNLEIGLNINHLHLYPRERLPVQGDPDEGAFVGNAQWIAQATSWLNVAMGTQQGVSAHDASKNVHYVGMGWTGLRIEPAHGRYGGYVLGGYYGTPSFTGTGSRAGGMVGFEAPILGERISFCADWMIGTNRLSVAVVGVQITPVPAWGWQLSLGAQLPILVSENGYAFILELTRVHGVMPDHSTHAEGRQPHHAS